MSGPVWVTGAAGFCGTHLCRELVANGEEVWGWVRRQPDSPVKGVRYVVGDLLEPGLLNAQASAAPPSRFYHLAAVADPRECDADPEYAERVNVDLVDQIVSVLVNQAPDCRLLYASTCHVYGVPETLPIVESHPLIPRGVYAESKARGESAALAGVRRGLHVVVSRAFHQSGPGHAAEFALGSWASQIASGAKQVCVGDVSVARDYTDVRDVSRGLICVLERAPVGSRVNLCSGRAVTLREMLARLIGDRTVEVVVEQARLRKADVPVLYGDASYAESLGWAPMISIEAMLEALLDSYSSRTSILPSPSVS